jgi:hypothetical protein
MYGSPAWVPYSLRHQVPLALGDFSKPRYTLASAWSGIRRGSGPWGGKVRPQVAHTLPKGMPASTQTSLKPAGLGSSTVARAEVPRAPSWGGFSSLWLDTTRLPVCGPRPGLISIGGSATAPAKPKVSQRLFWELSPGDTAGEGGVGVMATPLIFRMRPGYSTLWRRYRALLAQALQARI